WSSDVCSSDLGPCAQRNCDRGGHGIGGNHPLNGRYRGIEDPGEPIQGDIDDGGVQQWQNSARKQHHDESTRVAVESRWCLGGVSCWLGHQTSTPPNVCDLHALHPTPNPCRMHGLGVGCASRSEEQTSELQSRFVLECRILLEKKNTLSM